MSTTLVHNASQHISDTLRDVFQHDKNTMSLVIYDLNSPLAIILTDAYRIALPHGVFINFHEANKDDIMSQMEALESGNFVALIQSSSFRLSAFRIRIELFKKSIKVVEHPHLERMSKDNEVTTYVNALAYDKQYYHHNGHTLKNILKTAQGAVIHSGDEKLIYPGPFEDAKLNIGD